jgi:hypothetical protein
MRFVDCEESSGSTPYERRADPIFFIYAANVIAVLTTIDWVCQFLMRAARDRRCARKCTLKATVASSVYLKLWRAQLPWFVVRKHQSGEGHWSCPPK